MPARPWSAFFAVVLTAVLAYGYGGPIVCASVHGHDAAQVHEGPHAHHAVQVPTGAHALTPAGEHVGGCPDMGHCGLTLMGPAARGTPALLVAESGADRALPPAARWHGILTAPATPPPKA